MKKNGYTLIELVVTVAFVTFLLLMLGGCTVGVIFGVKGCNKVQEDGIKGTATELWEGQNQTNIVTVTNVVTVN